MYSQLIIFNVQSVWLLLPLLLPLLPLPGIPPEKWAATCVLVDKLDKLPVESVLQEIGALGGVEHDSAVTLINLIQVR